MKKLFITIAVIASSITSYADVVNSETILRMLEKGYSTPVIINQIEGADEVSLTCTLDYLDMLMAAGADQNLIMYIQNYNKENNKQSLSLEAGMYWHNTDDQPVQILVSPVQKKENNIGGKLLGGLASVGGTVLGATTGSIGLASTGWITGDILSSSNFKSDKLYIPGEHSNVVVNTTNPIFRFIKPGSDNAATGNDMWYYLWLANVQSPSEFQLIKLEPKGKGSKANRQFPSKMTWSAAGFSTSNETSKKNLVDFKVAQVENGVYEISFDQPLEPGEYAFFYKNTTSELLKGLSAFDFTVTE